MSNTVHPSRAFEVILAALREELDQMEMRARKLCRDHSPEELAALSDHQLREYIRRGTWAVSKVKAD